MQPLRLLAIALAATACMLAGAAAVSAETAPDAAAKAAAMAPINFFLARGDADACGPACNEWIAAEGKIDAGAAMRLRRLLAKLGRRRPPIYFHSPGGAITGSLELGRLIRDQKLEVSVAHTIPLGCDRDKPFEKACEAQKRSGQELESELDPTFYMCNSACVYAVAGGSVRLIPPGVRLGIHDVGFDPENPPPRALMSEVRRMAHARIQTYLRDMGMEDALYKAAAAVPFESRKLLEREDLVRFGIDRREFGETGWQLVDKPVPGISKRFFVRADGGTAPYVDAAVSLSCVHGQSVGLAIARQRGASETPDTGPRFLSISVQGQQYPLSSSEAPSQELDVRAAVLPASAFEAVGDHAAIGVSGTGLARHNDPAASVTLSMDGFSMAYARLQTSCNAAVPSPSAAALPGKPVPYVDPASLSGLSPPVRAWRPGAPFNPASPWPR